MDNNSTWQQGNLGSTGSGRSLQGLQHQQLSSCANGGIYPGGISTISNNQAAGQWQRVDCCSGSSSPSHLVSHQQQPQQNQAQQQQQQQQQQLRYFQLQKPGNPQHASHGSSSSSSIINQRIQSQNFAQQYALLGASSSLASSSVSLIADSSTQQAFETQSYSGCYLATAYHSSAKFAQALALKSAEEGRIHHQHHHHRYNNNNYYNYNHNDHHVNSRENDVHAETNQHQSAQALSALTPAYQPRYQIISGSGRIAIPASIGQVSLSTCFALTTGNATSNSSSSVEGCSVWGSTSSSLSSQVSLLAGIIPAYGKETPLGFVNAFEAVPDMLCEVRPGGRSTTTTTTTTTIIGRSSLTALVVGQPEFSYHAGRARARAQLSVSSQTGSAEGIRDRNWSELELRSHRPLSSSPGAQLVSSAPEKPVWKRITSTEELFREKTTFKATRRPSAKQQSARKTYAAAVQVTRRDTRERRSCCVDGRIMSEWMSSRLRILEAGGRVNNNNNNSSRVNSNNNINNNNNNNSNNNSGQSFRTSTPRKMETRGLRKRHEYEDSCEEDNEYSSTSTVSSGTNDTIPRSPERFSSPEGGTLKNWGGSSPSSSLHETEEEKENLETDGFVPARKKLSKMAESFCFGQLENEAFFRAFDEYNRRRRRMSYTLKLEDGSDSKSCHEDANSAAEEILALDRKIEAIGNNSPKFQSLLYAALHDNPMANFGVANNIQIRVEEMQNQGAFKVLQKLKECADGTGALYTNSWRPEELHFLRRCYQNKNI